MDKLNNRKKIAKKHIQAKLIKRLKIFIIIILIIIGIIIYKIILGDISIWLASKGLLFGTSIGLIAGRMFKMFWHPETEKVISRIDEIGVIFLLLYITVEIGKKWFFGHWLQGVTLNAFSLIFLAGLLLGRVLTMIKGIKNILIKQKKI